MRLNRRVPDGTHGGVGGRGLTAPSYPIVTAETVPEYWAGMAVRACTDRDENGQRILDDRMMEALPAPDYKRICNRVRTFFLITG